MSATEIRGPRDSFRIPAEHYLDFAEERWTPLPANGEWLAWLSNDDLNRIADDPSTGVLFVTLLSEPHRGARVVGIRSLLRYTARCGAEQNPAKCLDISSLLAGLKDT